MDAAYVFRVRFHLDSGGVRVDPRTFETVVEYPAPAPGDSGWLFFRNNLWRGEANDEAHLRDRVSEWLNVPVDSVAFSELRTDEAYLDALTGAIDDDLGAFNADDVTEAMHKYFGSSVRVVGE
jgi:hypothetical protein